MNSAEKLIEVRVKNEILVKWLKKKIKDRKENHYSFIDTDEVENLLKVMGYMDDEPLILTSLDDKEVLKAWDNDEPVITTTAEALTDWAPTNPATDVMDEEF